MNGGANGQSGAGGMVANNAGDGRAGDGFAGMSAGSGAGGVGAGGAGIGAGGAGTGAGGAGTGAGGFPAGQGGVGGRPIPGGEGGGASGMGGDILNPQDCATSHPFVLSIDPMGNSGTVSGWLESTAGLVFEEQLPRFVRSFNPERPAPDEAIALWWSIAMVDANGEGRLYFYAGVDFTHAFMEIAVAPGATRFSDIDVDALFFSTETLEASTGSFLVFRNALTGEVLALRVDQIYLTDSTDTGFCAGLDASWRFLR